MPITLDTSIGVSDDAVFREFDNELVILDLRSGAYFGLDEVGARIWHLIGEHGRLRTVFEHLLQEYDVAPDVLERDLLALATRLVEAGLGQPV